MSEPEATAAEVGAAGGEHAGVHAVRRLHNLAIFVDLLAVMFSYFVVRPWVNPPPPAVRITLLAGMIVLPIAAMVANGVFTHRRLQALARSGGEANPSFDALAMAFVRCKRFSIASLAVAVLFAAACISLFPHVWTGIIFTVPTLLLLLMVRPNMGGLLTFARLVQMHREDVGTGSSAEPDSAEASESAAGGE